MKHPSTLLTVLLLGPALNAQQGGESILLHQFDGQVASGYLGGAVANAGDVDADGFEDIIVGARMTSPGGLSHAGSAYVYSGASGNLLFQLDGFGAEDKFGSTVAGAGDVNGDGFDDLLVGSEFADTATLVDAGAAYVFSGSNGSLLYSFHGAEADTRLGRSVSTLGDLDGDGRADFIIGAPWANPAGMFSAGSAFVYSGASGSLLFQIDGSRTYDQFGGAVADVGDLDSDGVDDFLVSAHKLWNGPLMGGGMVSAYSGANGTLIFEIPGVYSLENLGRNLEGVGDANSDGVPDFLVAAERIGLDFLYPVYLYSGATQTVLQTILPPGVPNYFGDSLAGAHDVDGDDVPDFLISDLGSSAGLGASLYSGATGALLQNFESLVIGSNHGKSVAFIEDLNGDGRAEVLIGANKASPGGAQYAGSAYVLSFQPLMNANQYTLSATADTTINLALDFSNAASLHGYQVLLSASGVGPTTYGIEIPLTVDLLVMRSHQGNYPFSSSSNLHGNLDVAGNASASFTVLSSQILPSMIGRTFHLAAVTSQVSAQVAEFSSVAIPITIVP